MWLDPGVSRQLEHASEVYRRRRSAVCDELGSRGIEVQAPTGLNVWVPVDDEATATSSLLARGWLVAPGARFRIASAPAIRLTTAALPVERAAEVAGSIAAACAAAESKGRRAGSGG
jgi:DNA-binding transcriptional MocR family regulator